MIKLDFFNINLKLYNLYLSKQGKDTFNIDPPLFKRYIKTEKSKTGIQIPILFNGKPINSLYDPQKEALQLLSNVHEDSFVIFCGLGAGIHINFFLESFPDSECLIIEDSYFSLFNLFCFNDYSYILKNNKVHWLIVDQNKMSDTNLENLIKKTYKPALHGGLHLISLRPWQEINNDISKIIQTTLTQTIKNIMQDFSVQSYFGKIWFVNLLKNISLLSTMNNYLPKTNTQKEALILAAGPSLEHNLSLIENKRNKYILFSTDTVLKILSQKKIKSDFVISMDPQNQSCMHIIEGLDYVDTFIIDITGNPIIPQIALKHNKNVLFVRSNHPMSLFASNYFDIPYINSEHGTVTLTALDCAYALGFIESSIRLIGADFKYLDGKAYSKGTYLDAKFNSQSNRIQNIENKYVDLMFRTEVSSLKLNNKISYTTDILDSYALALTKFKPSKRKIINKDNLFTLNDFINVLIKDIHYFKNNEKGTVPFYLYPLLAWARTKNTEPNNKKSLTTYTLNLALDTIARYTKIL